MRTLPALAALIFGISPLVATASPAEPMVLNYAAFEEAVPHVDLADCPEGLAGEARFCRATLSNDAIHVFAFSEEGELPLIGFASYTAEALPGLLK